VKEIGIRRSAAEPLILSRQAEKSIATLSSLAKYGEYAQYAGDIQAAITFITDPNKSLADSSNFIFMFTSR
jgi:hypothetical protein